MSGGWVVYKQNEGREIVLEDGVIALNHRPHT
jgi:hypothetical protein